MANWFTTETTQGIRTLEDRTAGLERLQKNIRTLQTQEPLSVLDIGCAEGLIGDWLTMGSAKKLLGMEGDKIKVESAAQIYSAQIDEDRYRFIRTDVQDLAAVCRHNNIQEKFDIVLLLAILQKLGDPIPCLEKAVSMADKFVAIRAPQYFWDQHVESIDNIMRGWNLMYQIIEPELDAEHVGRLRVYIRPGLEERLDSIRTDLRSANKATSLSICDYPIVSFPKSGRTWIRYFLGRYLSIEHGMPMDLEFIPQPYWTEERRSLDFPRIHFTHDWFDLNHSDRRTPGILYKDILDKKPVIFLLRNPMDTIVSYYYHKVKREKIVDSRELDITRFILDERYGLGRYCAWLDTMLDYISARTNVMLLTYEGMVADMPREMNRMFDFMKIRGHRQGITAAAADSDFDNMQRAEIDANRDPNVVGIGRLGMKDWSGDPAQLKVRKGKIGSWKDELSLDETFMRGLVAGDDRIKVYLTRLKRRFPQCMTGLEDLVR